MTDQTSCPLCGEKLRGWNIENLNDPHSVCNNLKCFCWGIIQPNNRFEELKLQISRIKQQAKQDVFDDIEFACSLCTNKSCGVLHYVFSKMSLEEIKKKHGVE